MDLCDEAFNQCAISEEILESSLKSCEEVVIKQDELISADKDRILDLSAKADHTHIPHVAGTSAFWLLLFFLL